MGHGLDYFYYTFFTVYHLNIYMKTLLIFLYHWAYLFHNGYSLQLLAYLPVTMKNKCNCQCYKLSIQLILFWLVKREIKLGRWALNFFSTPSEKYSFNLLRGIS